MGITFYTPASDYPDERRRERAVELSGALTMQDDAALQAIVEDARRLFRVSMAAVSIVYRDWQYLIAAAGLAPGPYSRRTSFCGHVITERDAIFCVPDAQADGRFADHPAVTQSGLIRFYAGAKLMGEEHMPLGALCVFDSRPQCCLPRDNEVQLIELAAGVMARIGALHDRSRPG